MPFTPFHLGPGLFIAMLFFPFIDVVVILVASVIIDIEPAYYLFVHGYAYHGFFHSYLGCSIVAIVLSIGMYPLRRFYLKVLDFFGLRQKTDLKKILVSSLIGTNFHVLLDQFLYPEMTPFYPISGNPLLGMFDITTIYSLCIFMFILGVPLYAIHLIRSKRR